MITNIGKDGRYCATAVGAMARIVVADGTTRAEAMNECYVMLAEHMKMLEDAQTVIRERREMRADRHRELALEEHREHLRDSQSQSGVKLV